MNRRKRMLNDLDENIRDHIEAETQDNIARGMPPEDARYAALRKFGNVTRIQRRNTRSVEFLLARASPAGHSPGLTHVAQVAGPSWPS